MALLFVIGRVPGWAIVMGLLMCVLGRGAVAAKQFALVRVAHDFEADDHFCIYRWASRRQSNGLGERRFEQRLKNRPGYRDQGGYFILFTVYKLLS